MMLRRRIIEEKEEPFVHGIYSRRNITNSPLDPLDTNIKLVDTNKTFSILFEMEFPNATIITSGNYQYWSCGLQGNYILPINIDNTQNASNLDDYIIGNYMRLHFMGSNQYQYTFVETHPFYSNDKPHRFIISHESGTVKATINFDGYGTKTVTGTDFVTSNNNVYLCTDPNIKFNSIAIYDRLLTEAETTAFITNGIYP